MKRNLLLFISLTFLGCNLSFSQAGLLDTSFDPGTGPSGSGLYSVAIQDDGKILIGGAFNVYDGTGRLNIARLNDDGSIDLSFDPGSGANGALETVVLQSDGKVIIGGWFTTFNGTARNYIARLNADGSLDTSFDPGAGASSRIRTAFIQSDGKILIGGEFTTFDGVSRNRIARLNTDGSLDTSFDPGTGVDNIVYTISEHSDGKIVIGGEFTTMNGTARNNVARLNADGSLDTSFDPGTGANNRIRSASFQGDGKIIIGGDFTSYDGTAKNRITRLNTDGSLDATFVVGSGASHPVYTTFVQGDGKILIGGQFTTYSGFTTVRNRIARLNADGTLDTSFNPEFGPSHGVRDISIQSDGKIIIVGVFDTFNGTPRKYIARLQAETLGIFQLTNENENVTLFPNPFSHSATITVDGKSLQNATVRIYDMTGALVQSIDGISGNTIEIKRNELGEGMYFYQLIENDNIHSAKKFVIAD